MLTRNKMRQYFYLIFTVWVANLCASTFSVDQMFIPKINTNDINKNGHIDFISLDGELVHWSVSLQEISANSNVNTLWSYSLKESGDEIVDVDWGDFDGDGIKELLIFVNSTTNQTLQIFSQTDGLFSKTPTHVSSVPIKNNLGLFPKECQLIHWDSDSDVEFALNFSSPSRMVVIGDFENGKFVSLAKPAEQFIRSTFNPISLSTLPIDGKENQALVIANMGEKTTGMLTSLGSDENVNPKVLPLITRKLLPNGYVLLDGQQLYSMIYQKNILSANQNHTGIDIAIIDGVNIQFGYHPNGDISRYIDRASSADKLSPEFVANEFQNVYHLLFEKQQKIVLIHGGDSPELAVLDIGLSVDPTLQNTSSTVAEFVVSLNQPFQHQLDIETENLTSFDSQNLPTGSTIDETTFTYSWTPNLNALGYHTIYFDSKYRILQNLVKTSDDNSINFTRQDSTFVISDSISIYVNDPPQILNSETEYLIISGDTLQIPIRVLDRNIDAVHSFSINTNTSQFSIENDTVFQWIPDLEHGKSTFEIDVKDGYSTDSYNFEVTVHPQIHIAETPANLMGEVNKEFYYKPDVSQLGSANTILFELLYAPENMEINENGEIRWIPLITQVDTHNFTLVASDSITSTAVDIAVFVNSPPIIAKRPSQLTIIRDGELFNTTFSSFDSNALPSLKWNLLSSPDGMILNADGSLQWTPTKIGLFTFTVELSDGITNTDFTGSIYVNALPEITSQPPNFINIGDTLLYTVTFEDNNIHSINNMALEHRVTLTQGPSNAKLLDNHELVWIPQESQFGVQSFEISIFDGAETITHLFDVFVNEIPTIISKNSIQVKSSEDLQHQLQVVDTNNDAISYHIQRLNADTTNTHSGVYLDSTTGLLSWKTSKADLGVHRFEVQASDGHPNSFDTQQLSVLVYEPPTITNAMPPEAFVGMDYLFTPQAENMYGKKEMLEDIFLTITSSTSHNIMFLDTAGVLLWTPTQEDVGLHTVKLTVSDQFGISSDYQYNIHVFENPCDPCDNEIEIIPPEKEER